MFSTIARLSIRDEFCQKVSDLEGVRIVLESLEDNMEDKVSISVMQHELEDKCTCNIT